MSLSCLYASCVYICGVMITVVADLSALRTIIFCSMIFCVICFLIFNWDWVKLDGLCCVLFLLM